MITHRARRIIQRYNQEKAAKQVWNNLYELIGQYVFTRKQHFSSSVNPGEMQNTHIFDDTAVHANPLMAASFIGALWPNGAKSFRMSMPFSLQDEISTWTAGQVNDTEEIKDYYEWVTKRMAAYMDNPKAGLRTALEEYMLDQGSFGTSGVMIEDVDSLYEPLNFRAVDAKVMAIEEAANGSVGAVYIERQFLLRQLVEEYGYDALTVKQKELFDQGDIKTKVNVLHVIEPRLERDPYGFGAKNMPVASIHIDIGSEKILRESGYQEMPVAICRFWKAMGEKYGRSPAMNALPSILEANALGEAWTLAIEKTLDPPLLVLDDGSNGNGTIDTGPGGMVVFSPSGRLGNQDPVKPLFLVGDLQWTAARRTELGENIKNHFFIDRLMDLNSEQRMQNPEVYLRNELRGQSLNTVHSRQIAELFVPLIQRCFNILFRKGLLGVVEGSEQEARLIDAGISPKIIPDLIAQRMATGQDIYEIEMISPAVRMMQAEELKGIQMTVNSALSTAPVVPNIVDTVDFDFAMKRIQELSGAPPEVIHATETVKRLRDYREKQMQIQQQLAAEQAQSETARNAGQAMSAVASAEGNK